MAELDYYYYALERSITVRRSRFRFFFEQILQVGYHFDVPFGTFASVIVGPAPCAPSMSRPAPATSSKPRLVRLLNASSGVPRFEEVKNASRRKRICR